MEHRLNLAFVERLSQQSVEEALKTCKKKAWQEEAKSKAMKGFHFRVEKLEESYQAKAMEHGVAGSLQSATKIASRREEGSGNQDLPIPSLRVGRKEAFAKWFEDGADREELISIMIQSILTNSLGAWKGEQDTDSSEAEEGSKPTGTRTTGRVLCWEIRRRWLRKARHRHLKDNVFRML